MLPAPAWMQPPLLSKPGTLLPAPAGRAPPPQQQHPQQTPVQRRAANRAAHVQPCLCDANTQPSCKASAAGRLHMPQQRSVQQCYLCNQCATRLNPNNCHHSRPRALPTRPIARTSQQPKRTCLAASAAASRALMALNFSPRPLPPLGAAEAEVEAAASTCLGLRRAFSSLPVWSQGGADIHGQFLGKSRRGVKQGWRQRASLNICKVCLVNDGGRSKCGRSAKTAQLGQAPLQERGWAGFQAARRPLPPSTALPRQARAAACRGAACCGKPTSAAPGAAWLRAPEGALAQKKRCNGTRARQR